MFAIFTKLNVSFKKFVRETYIILFIIIVVFYLL